jgi:5'-3' exonuclease
MNTNHESCVNSYSHFSIPVMIRVLVDPQYNSRIYHLINSLDPDLIFLSCRLQQQP